MKVKTTIGTNTLLASAKQLMIQGLITKEQYNAMKLRSLEIPEENKKDIVELME